MNHKTKIKYFGKFYTYKELTENLAKQHWKSFFAISSICNKDGENSKQLQLFQSLAINEYQQARHFQEKLKHL